VSVTLETAVAFALRDPTVMDQLGSALRSDLVTANPHLRRIVEFADDFLLQRRKLPAPGDWTVWLDSLQEGMIRDGAREALGRLWSTNTDSFDASFFVSNAIPQLKQAAAQVARARLNEMPIVTPDVFATLAEKLDAVQGGGLQGLAHLDDVNTWAHPVRADEFTPTGLPTLDRLIGGWGHELWMVFADSGMGKSMILQNFASAAAIHGKRVLHVTLELGVRPQIHRYYRALARAERGEFSSDLSDVKRRLARWFRLARGEVLLIEFPAYSLEPGALRRTIERVNRTVGNVDLLILDYIDLMTLPRAVRAGSTYEDLGRLTHECRSLCPAFELGVLTASQAIRKPKNAGRLTLRDMGDSYKKVAGSDGLLALQQTPEEREVHQGRLSILKARDSGGRDAEIPLYINRDLAVISDLSHPNTEALMQRLGHLPTAKGGAVA